MIRQLGNNQIHMSAIVNNKTKNKILSKLNFDNKECMGFCYRIELSNAISNELKLSKSKHISKQRAFKESYYVIWSQIQDSIMSFLQRHNCDIYDVVFQCDGDMRGFFKTIGLQYAYKGDAYVISDILAWANNRGWEPPGTVCQDISSEVATGLKNSMR